MDTYTLQLLSWTGRSIILPERPTALVGQRISPVTIGCRQDPINWRESTITQAPSGPLNGGRPMQQIANCFTRSTPSSTSGLQGRRHAMRPEVMCTITSWYEYQTPAYIPARLSGLSTRRSPALRLMEGRAQNLPTQFHQASTSNLYPMGACHIAPKHIGVQALTRLASTI